MLTEVEQVMLDTDIKELYFSLSTSILNNKDYNITTFQDFILNKAKNSVVTLDNLVDNHGLYIRGLRNNFWKFFTQDGYAEEKCPFEQTRDKDVSKWEHIVRCGYSYIDTDKEDRFYQILYDKCDNILLDVLLDGMKPLDYQPHPEFTKMMNECFHKNKNNNKAFNHLNENIFKTLIHHLYTNINTNNKEFNKICVIFPNHYYSNLFCEMYGHTQDSDLKYGYKYNESDAIIHPRYRPFIYAGMGISLSYALRHYQIKYSSYFNHKKLYSYGIRGLRYGVNTLTISGLIGYFGLCYGYTILSQNNASLSIYAKNVQKLRSTPNFKKKTWQ